MTKISQQLIVETAARLIEETGTIDISLTKIAATLGITHAALYKHFSSKQAIWEAVAFDWFEKTIIQRVHNETILIDGVSSSREEQLHDWLWAFVNAKKEAYSADEQMFILNTEYVDNNSLALRKVLTSAYCEIDRIMGYQDTQHERSETILAAFTIFTLPNFRETWNWPDYQPRFEAMWALIRSGL